MSRRGSRDESGILLNASFLLHILVFEIMERAIRAFTRLCSRRFYYNEISLLETP